MNEWPPKKISIDDEGWSKGHTEAMVAGSRAKPYVATSHAFAKRRPDICAWLAPSCSECLPYFSPDDLTISSKDNPFGSCEDLICNRGPTPYREGWK